MNPSDRVQALESLLQRVQQNARARPSHGHAPVAAPPAARAAAPSTRPPPSDDGVLELSDDDVRQDEPTIPPPGSASPPPRQALPLTSLDDDEVTAVRPAYADDDAPRISMGSEAEIVLDVDFDDVHLVDEPTASADTDAAIAREHARAEAEREAREAEAAKRAAEAEAAKKAAEAEAAKRAAEAEEAAPISTRQARPKDEVREMDFDDLGAEEEEQPPESGEVASQRKPTIDPALTALADWQEEETEEGEEGEVEPAAVARGTEPPKAAQGGAAEVRLHVPAVQADVEPVVVRRSAGDASDVVAFVDAAKAPAAESFGALLDASLSLGS